MAIISRNLISRLSKNSWNRENLATRKFPGIRYSASESAVHLLVQSIIEQQPFCPIDHCFHVPHSKLEHSSLWSPSTMTSLIQSLNSSTNTTNKPSSDQKILFPLGWVPSQYRRITSTLLPTNSVTPYVYNTWSPSFSCLHFVMDVVLLSQPLTH